jgi:hypothetical protein
VGVSIKSTGENYAIGVVDASGKILFVLVLEISGGQFEDEGREKTPRNFHRGAF